MEENDYLNDHASAKVTNERQFVSYIDDFSLKSTMFKKIISGAKSFLEVQ